MVNKLLEEGFMAGFIGPAGGRKGGYFKAIRRYSSEEEV